MDLREKEWESVDWIHLALDRDQWWALANSYNPSGSIKGRDFLD
jgi:hypothetical protein